MDCLLQLSRAGREDKEFWSSVDVRITYRTRVFSDVQRDITRAYAVDIFYRQFKRKFLVSISTDVDDQSSGSFVVTVNGLTLADPLRQPLLLREVRVKQLTNFAVVVSTDNFRLEFDLDSRIYVRLDARFENKVRQLYLLLVVVQVEPYSLLCYSHKASNDGDNLDNSTCRVSHRVAHLVWQISCEMCVEMVEAIQRFEIRIIFYASGMRKSLHEDAKSEHSDC